MSYLTPHDRRKCQELGARILNVFLKNRVAAATIFTTALESVAHAAERDERTTIALLMIRAALKIDASILDARH